MEGSENDSDPAEGTRGDPRGDRLHVGVDGGAGGVSLPAEGGTSCERKRRWKGIWRGCEGEGALGGGGGERGVREGEEEEEEGEEEGVQGKREGARARLSGVVRKWFWN